jgi:hypothetical protein
MKKLIYPSVFLGLELGLVGFLKGDLIGFFSQNAFDVA